MSYAEKTLSTEEKIVFSTKPSWIIFLQLVVWVILIVLMPIKKPFMAIGVFSIFSLLATYYCSEYTITNKRIIMKTGFFRRKIMETFLNRVEGLAVDQSIFGRLFNYGTITIIGVGGTRNHFTFVSHPLEFRKNVQQNLDHVAVK